MYGLGVRKYVVGVVLALCLALVLWLILRDSGSSPEPVGASVNAAKANAATINVRLPSDFPSLDPMVDATNANAWASITPGYDRMIAIRKDGKGFGPYIATAWEQTPTSVKFTVRKDAKCSDGHVLTPTDMKNSYDRFLTVEKRGGSPASSSGGGWGPGPWEFEADDEAGTLTLTLGKPWGPVLGLFAALPIICPSGLEALESDPDALATNVYGSGPYTLESATHSAQIVYKLRKEWNWGPPGSSTKAMPGTLIYRITKDQTTAANQLLTGGLDIGSVSGADVERLLKDPKLGHMAVPNWSVTALSFNMRKGRPFAEGSPDAKILREAIYKAINPSEVNQAVYGGRAVETPTFFRPEATCFDKSVTAAAPKPSIDAGKAVLAQAGYEVVGGRLSKDGKPVKKLNLVSTPSLYPNGGAYIQSVLRQLGFQAELHESAADYATSIIAGNFDLAVVVANRPSPEPGTQMNHVAGGTSPNGGNIGGTGEGDPEWLEAYNAGLAASGDEACAHFAKMQQSNLQNFYAVPLTSNNYEVFYRKDVFGSLPNWPTEVFGYPWFEVALK